MSEGIDMFYVDEIPYSVVERRLEQGDVLEHFGIKGMKWGVRRFQNEDGSLTPAGEKRYGMRTTFDGKMTKKGQRKYDKDRYKINPNHYGYRSEAERRADYDFEDAMLNSSEGGAAWLKKHQDDGELENLKKSIENQCSKYISEWQSRKKRLAFSNKWDDKAVEKEASQYAAQVSKYLGYRNAGRDEGATEESLAAFEDYLKKWFFNVDD